MIKYTVKCGKGHIVDAWYQNSGAFDRLKKAGKLTCEIPGCKSTKIEKTLMAPNIGSGDKGSDSGMGVYTEHEIRTAVEAGEFGDDAKYVGYDYAKRIRAGDEKVVGIATPEETQALLEEGRPIAMVGAIKSPRKLDA